MNIDLLLVRVALFVMLPLSAVAAALLLREGSFAWGFSLLALSIQAALFSIQHYYRGRSLDEDKQPEPR